MQASCPAPTTARPSTVIDSTRFALPAGGIVHRSAPVSTITEPPALVTFRPPITVDGPVARVTGPVIPAGTTVAKPLHFNEPSGQ
jgi:hypothetical protein